ncbi:MAG: VWA domain-containing protein [Chloroflexales bacterium]|nr:VWA domain-containing protein [Chloroflexales bacterium]
MRLRPYSIGLLIACIIVVSACGLGSSLDAEDVPPVSSAPKTEDATTSDADVAAPATSITAADDAGGGPNISGSSVSEPSVRQPNVSGPSAQQPDVNAPSVQQPDVATSEATPTAVPRDWQVVYKKLQEEYGEDYSTCEVATTSGGTCPKPESLGTTELKEQINIQLILDSSGSMAGEIDGQQKLDVAKQAILGFIETIPDNAKVSLRVYGHFGSNAAQDKALSCANTELLYPFVEIDRNQFTAAINAFEPTGWTPIDSSLQAAQDDFASFDPATSSNFIYLVSDGIETCDGDPVAAARSLHESDVQAIVNIVGFDVDQAAAEQLRAAATAGGGDYHDARNAEELSRVFREVHDWDAWNRYYNCVSNTANRTYTESYNAQNERYQCIYNIANQEYTNIYNTLIQRRDEYVEIDHQIRTAAQDQRDQRIEDARQIRDETIEAARQQRDQTIEQTREERATVTSQP